MNVCSDLSLVPLQAKRVSLALGMFDGVHLGHQKVLTALQKMAQYNHSVPVVFSFFPHPKEFLTGQAPLQILDQSSWCMALSSRGIEAAVMQPFDEELAQLSPLEFLNRYFGRREPLVCGICVGKAFRFGAGNAGTSQDIEQWCKAHHIDCTIVPEAMYKDEVISSSRIRKAIQSANFHDAQMMLGEPYFVSGRVIHGQDVGGKELGFPTANLQLENALLPPPGVYVANGYTETRTLLQGIVYVGDAPSIRTDGKVVLEFHVFDFSGDLYDQQLFVIFRAFIRESRRFESRAALVEQINQDIQIARESL